MSCRSWALGWQVKIRHNAAARSSRLQPEGTYSVFSLLLFPAMLIAFFFPFCLIKNNQAKPMGKGKRTDYLFIKPLNVMQFTGRITADAEVRNVKNDKKVTAFTVAVNKRYKNKAGEKQEKTSFIRCAYWINPGLATYLTKGAIVDGIDAPETGHTSNHLLENIKFLSNLYI